MLGREYDMNKVGIKKDLDKLGRIVIPHEMRRLYSIEKEVELVATEEGILVRSPLYRLVKYDVEETTK